MGAEEKIDELLIDLPEPPIKPDEFSYVVVSGKQLHVAGVLPFAEGGKLYGGRAGANIRVDNAMQAARSAVLQALSIIRHEIGSLNNIRRIVRLEVYIASNPDFKDHRAISDAASNLINSLFGAVGRHCQLVMGVPSLPKGSCVSLAIQAEIK